MAGILVYKRKKSKIRVEKTPKQLERHIKGVANHHRIRILMLIAENPNLGVEDIAQKMGVHFKTVSSHTLRLAQAGLIEKNYKGAVVCHSLSPYGHRIYHFLKSF